MDASLPAPGQVALALIVIRSKPVGKLLEGYIRDLRQIIVNRGREQSASNEHYVNGVLFWKRAYEDCARDKLETDNKIFDLERRLLKQDQIERTQDSGNVKRRQPEKNVRANTQTKRRKLDSVDQEKLSFDDNELDNATTASGCPTLLRSYLLLRQGAISREGDPESAWQLIKASCHLASSNLTERKKQPPTSPACKIEEILRIVGKVWQAMLDILAGQQQNHDTQSPTCIPDMVLLLQSLLSQLHQHLLDEADRLLKLRRRNGKTGRTNLTRMDKLQHAVCKAIAITMGRMFMDLDMTRPSHTTVFEGLTCLLLDHIGSSLSLLVFGDPTVSKEKERGIAAPQGLLDVAHIDTETAIATVQLAGPYLVHILNAALKVAEKGECDFYTDSTTNKVVVDMKQRLQHTLLRGMYGDDDDTFKSALARADEASEVDMQEIHKTFQQQKDSSEWFLGQIWERLGWDILVAEDRENP